jgi:hypothetical protein
MSTELASDHVFHWICMIGVGGLSVLWFLYDSINLYRLRTADRRDPLVRDKHFGYVMGLVISTIGMVGALRYQGII